MILALLALHGCAAVAAPWLVRRVGVRAFLPLAGVLILTLLAIAAGAAGPAGDGRARTESLAWIPTLGVELAFRIDVLAMVMVVLVAGVGACVLVYCERYFSGPDPAVGRTAGVLVAFAGAMLGLVVADDLILIYVFWELTTVFSYLLIGHDPRKIANRQAAMRALIVTTFGGLAMLVGLVLLGEMAGTYRLSEILREPPTGATVSVALVLILVGALSKSALFPFSFWLPGAMAAPTPVSAYLHAAAMVKAGIYLLARLGPAFAEDPVWRPVVLTLGIVTMVVGAKRALAQYDLKLLLAYGTVSQLGFLVTLVGAGNRDAALAGVAALLAHGLFKSALFLVVGIIDHTCGTRDLRKLTCLTQRMRGLAIVTLVALASMAGLPPTLGFVAKEAAFEAFMEQRALDWAVLAGLVLGSALTFTYSARFFWGAFWSKADVPLREVRPAGGVFIAMPALLAVSGAVLGVLASPLDPVLTTYADVYPQQAHPYHLALWHGLTPSLGLTAVVIVAGLGLSRFQHRAYSSTNAYTSFGESERTYRQTAQEVDRVALRLTSLTQRGSLPAFLATMLVTLVALPGSSLLLADELPTHGVRLWDTPFQLMVAVLIIAAAGLAARARHRLFAALLTGVVGYGVAVLFALQGAPDIALTQFLIETMALVVFVLVLRRLPTHFSGHALAGRRVLRLVLATGVGVLASILCVVALSARTAEPISSQFGAAAKQAGGDNIVNTTLVDMRAWDTMGEISVLVAVATGVASLVFVRRRQHALTDASQASASGQVWAHDWARDSVETDELEDTDDTDNASDTDDASDAGGSDYPGTAHVPARRAAQQAGSSWLPGEHTLAPERRSMLVEVVTRMTFHAMIIFSVYLTLAGHNLPGGGFAGGLVAGLALVVRYLAGGRYELGETLRVDARIPLGIGLTVAVGTGVVAMIAGAEFLESGSLDLHLPLLGHLHIVSSTFFDVGVYLVVVGLILEILTSLGAEVDRQEERERRQADASAADTDSDTSQRGDERTRPAASGAVSAEHGGEMGSQ